MDASGIKNGIVDRVAMAVSGLCLVHCLLTALALGTLSTLGGALGSPIIHEVGLALAILLGIAALGYGLITHGRLLPLAVGGLGICVMAAALMMPHGALEMMVTVAGVILLACGHLLNRLASL